MNPDPEKPYAHLPGVNYPAQAALNSIGKPAGCPVVPSKPKKRVSVAPSAKPSKTRVLRQASQYRAKRIKAMKAEIKRLRRLLGLREAKRQGMTGTYASP